jgi:hypothetical protein
MKSNLTQLANEKCLSKYNPLLGMSVGIVLGIVNTFSLVKPPPLPRKDVKRGRGEGGGEYAMCFFMLMA